MNHLYSHFNKRTRQPTFLLACGFVILAGATFQGFSTWTLSDTNTWQLWLHWLHIHIKKALWASLSPPPFLSLLLKQHTFPLSRILNSRRTTFNTYTNNICVYKRHKYGISLSLPLSLSTPPPSLSPFYSSDTPFLLAEFFVVNSLRTTFNTYTNNIILCVYKKHMG